MVSGSAPVAGLPLTASAEGAAFTGDNVRLDRDLVLRIRPKGGEPLRLTAFRNPEGVLPEGLALAPWERPSEIPPEKDGFFLLVGIFEGDPRDIVPYVSADALDAGFDGHTWHRTGHTFFGWPVGYRAPVCRFYAPGPKSHLFTARIAECEALRPTDHGWDLPRQTEEVRRILEPLNQRGVRTAIFMDPTPDAMEIRDFRA